MGDRAAKGRARGEKVRPRSLSVAPLLRRPSSPRPEFASSRRLPAIGSLGLLSSALFPQAGAGEKRARWAVRADLGGPAGRSAVRDRAASWRAAPVAPRRSSRPAGAGAEDDRELARDGDCGDMVAASTSDPASKKDRDRVPGSTHGLPGGLCQHGARVRPTLLGDPPVPGHPLAGLMHARVQAEIGNQLVRAGEAVDGADRRQQPDGDHNVDARDGPKSLHIGVGQRVARELAFHGSTESSLEAIVLAQVPRYSHPPHRTARVGPVSVALGVEAVKAVAACTSSPWPTSSALWSRPNAESSLRGKPRFYLRLPALLIVDEIGYLPVVPGGGNLSSSWLNTRWPCSGYAAGPCQLPPAMNAAR